MITARQALLLGVFLTACGTKVLPPVPPHECESRSDCLGGKVCSTAFTCVNCGTSGQCRTKELCDPTQKLCVLRPGWGTDCSTNDQCQAGAWCKQGLCLDRSMVSLCPDGINSECGQGERCNLVTTVCEEDLGCSDDGDCSVAEKCNEGSRACVPKCTTANQATVCNPGEKCVAERCAQCAANSECSAGLVCDAAGKCSAPDRCYTDRDCSVPLVCFKQIGKCVAKPPPCSSDDACAQNEKCDVSRGTCVPRTCQPDRYEPDNDADHAFGVAPGLYESMTLCPGDVDWYSVDLARGDQIGINVDADIYGESNFSTVVKDSTGRAVASGHFLVSYVASNTSRYFLEFSTLDAIQPYDFTLLKSRGTPCDDDVYEPNDSPSLATSINSSSNLDGQICPQDQDWFSVTVPSSLGMTASLTNYDSTKGLLRLCGFNGTTSLGCSEDIAPSIHFASSLVAGKSIFLRVVGSTDQTANGYTLHLEFL